MKEAITACFLILHYNGLGTTNKAVNYLLKLNKIDECRILVVDNCSSDGSGGELDRVYACNSMVTVIHTDKNDGFSAGNNFGFKYIKQHFDTDFVVCMNNDVFIRQNRFIELLGEMYCKTPFYVAGPDIFDLSDMKHGNPQYCALPSVDVVLERIRKKERFKEILDTRDFKRGYLKYIKYKYWNMPVLKPIIRLNTVIKSKDSRWRERRQNCVLYGACLIFDKRFVDCNDYLFEPITFLYCEEELLARRCEKEKWNTIYFPELKVIHIGEASGRKQNLSFETFCSFKSRNIGIRIRTDLAYLKSITDLKQE